MAGYTKADFYSLYAISPVDPVTSRRYTEIRLHYHPMVKARMGFKVLAEKLVAYRNIGASDRILLPGCGYGWLGRELELLTNCQCVGLELSQHIIDTKDADPNDELIEAIEASAKCNFTYATGIGKEIWDIFKTDGLSKRSDIEIWPSLPDYEPVNLKQFRPDYVIVEDVLNAIPSEDHDAFKAELASYGGEVIHTITGVIV